MMKTMVVLVCMGMWWFAANGADRKPVRLTYATMSASVYGVLADQEGPWGFQKDSYFTTLKLTAYFKVFGWTVAAGLPEQLTLELYDVRSLSRYGVHPSDFSLQLGRRFGMISPRVIVKIPMGYPTSDAVAWTGSGNIRAGLGTGFAIARLMNRRISITGDGEVLSTINDTAGYPRFGIGSISGYAAVKGSFSPVQKLTTSLQAYCDFGNIRYSDWSGVSQRSITVAPLVSVSYLVGKRLTVGGWGGFGTKFSSLLGGSSSRVIIAGVSTGYGF